MWTDTTPIPLQARHVKSPSARPEPEHSRQVTTGGLTFMVVPGSPKYQKIASAAAMACMPICPSRDLGLELSGPGPAASDIVKSLYGSIAPDANLNPRASKRLENKLAYAMRNTSVEIRFFHCNREPPLVTHYRQQDPAEFRYLTELGWQDPITVTVNHNLALLPGPGRLLAREVQNPDGSPDEVSETIELVDGVYVYPLSASATLGNEGQKPVIRYVYHAY